jgi:hypothetical protein
MTTLPTVSQSNCLPTHEIIYLAIGRFDREKRIKSHRSHGYLIRGDQVKSIVLDSAITVQYDSKDTFSVRPRSTNGPTLWLPVVDLSHFVNHVNHKHRNTTAAT